MWNNVEKEQYQKERERESPKESRSSRLIRNMQPVDYTKTTSLLRLSIDKHSEHFGRVETSNIIFFLPPPSLKNNRFPKIEGSHFRLRRLLLPPSDVDQSIPSLPPPVFSAVGPSMAVPFPRKTLRYSKSGNSLFMVGSENLERYWKRPGRESKR